MNDLNRLTPRNKTMDHGLRFLAEWTPMRLFDRLDMLNLGWRVTYWNIRHRRWGYQLIRRARTK